VSDKNLAERARMNAGLSLGQAAKFTGIDRDDLIRIERAETIDADVVEKLCDIYGVRSEWITGEVPRYDYVAVDKISGASCLPDSDRDTIAEFAAAMPRGTKSGSAADRLAEYKKNRSKP
jgi:transcriptional regulator with XRE-family HTH domain